MPSHADLWRGLDALAAGMGLSVSGLAKRAGLDPTIFNPSKRVLPDGRERWPSTESLSKALNVAGMTLAGFAALVPGLRDDEPAPARAAAPKRALERAAALGLFDPGGAPAPERWGSVDLPIAHAADLYALELIDNTMAPIYRFGDLVIASCAAPIRTNDRVVVYTAQGHLLLRQLIHRTDRAVELAGLGFAATTKLIDNAHIRLIHRIVMVTQ